MKLRFILKPLDTIFFGQEKSPFKQEYFQQSRMLPQQTTVLGFLRYEALRRSGKLGKDPRATDWDSLIGSASFNGSTGQTFGVIQNISPVSIYQTESRTDLFPLRDPCGFQTKPVEAKVDFGDGTAWNSLTLFEKQGHQRYDPKQSQQFSIIFSDYNGQNFKAECPEVEGHKKKHGYNMPEKNDGIFWSDVRPGITKNYNGVSNDEGFFRTQFWRMMPDFAYSFLVEIDEHDDLIESGWKKKDIVRFGGDRSLYSMSAVAATDAKTNTGLGNVFVLQSDALVSNSIYNHCVSAVTDTLHFRNLRTSTSDNKFTRRPNDWKVWKKDPTSTEAKIFMKHGSILIAKDGETEKLGDILRTETAYRTIGYNHFKQFNQLPKGIDHDNI